MTVSAPKESFAQCCSGVLEELRNEALKEISGQDSHTTGSDDQQQNPSGATSMQRPVEAPREADQSNAGRASTLPCNSDMTDVPAIGPHPLRSLYETDWPEEYTDAILPPFFHGVDGIRNYDHNTSMIDRIDRWGFSSLTGY